MIGKFEILDSELFGEFSRYKLETCRGRDGNVVYFVTDAEQIDDLGLPAVIRQTSDREAAVEGLVGEVSFDD